MASIRKSRYDQEFRKIKKANIKKLKNLSSSQASIIVNTQQKCVFNFTDVVLPEEVNRILTLEPNFGLPVTNIDVKPVLFIKNIEDALDQVNIEGMDLVSLNDEKSNIRGRVVNILNNFYFGHNNRIDKAELYEKTLVKDFKRTRKFLGANKEIIVSRSDKGNSTVVMYKHEYVTKLEEMLGDNETYQLITKDPTVKFMEQANGLVTRLFGANVISEDLKKYLIIRQALPPKLYGLRKVHKSGCALRPVVSCISSPGYKLARFLHNTLAPVIKTFKFNLKNSHEFVEGIKNIRLPENYRLVSLDVVSLFTNIPKDLVLEIIIKNWDEWSKLIKVPKELLLELVKYCFNSSYFTIDGKIYRQLDGSAMGNPASPALANLVVNDVMEEVMRDLPFEIKLLKIYVDDSIAAVPQDCIGMMLDLFNSYHRKIQFTMEVEVERSIPFLDLRVIRAEDGTIIIDWYRKPTHSGRILNYRSNHPSEQKIGIIKGMTLKILNNTHEKFHQSNLGKLKELLVNNNYPRAMIKIAIDASVEKWHRTNSNTNLNLDEATGNKRFMRFPFIKHMSSKINACFMDTNIKLVYYNVKQVKSCYTKLKDKTPLLDQFGIIYKIPCECDKCYVGQTRQHLKKRIAQHKYDCKKIKLVNHNVLLEVEPPLSSTVLALHHLNTGHRFKFEDVSMLDQESHWKMRNIGEMCFIKMNNTINKRTDTQNLSSVYNVILNCDRAHSFDGTGM